jgi:hypothetical protein
LDGHGHALPEDSVQPMAIENPQAAAADNTQPFASSKPCKLQARFGHRRTHNEQLIIAPCSMILAWETFYSTEAGDDQANFLGGHIFCDNNCSMKHIVSDDPNIGLPVDVLHFNCKHSDNDLFVIKIAILLCSWLVL